MWRVWRDSLGLVTGSLEGSTRSLDCARDDNVKAERRFVRAALLVVI